MNHKCHWPGCEKQVPPAMWGCRFHWYQLPIRFRNAIMAAYRPGQELNKNPSPAYIEAAKAAREWIGKQRTHPWRQRQNNGGKL